MYQDAISYKELRKLKEDSRNSAIIYMIIRIGKINMKHMYRMSIRICAYNTKTVYNSLRHRNNLLRSHYVDLDDFSKCRLLTYVPVIKTRLRCAFISQMRNDALPR